MWGRSVEGEESPGLEWGQGGEQSPGLKRGQVVRLRTCRWYRAGERWDYQVWNGAGVVMVRTCRWNRARVRRDRQVWNRAGW